MVNKAVEDVVSLFILCLLILCVTFNSGSKVSGSGISRKGRAVQKPSGSQQESGESCKLIYFLFIIFFTNVNLASKSSFKRGTAKGRAAQLPSSSLSSGQRESGGSGKLINLFLIIKLKCSETFLDLSTVESSEDELTTAGTGGAARDSVQVKNRAGGK